MPSQSKSQALELDICRRIKVLLPTDVAWPGSSIITIFQVLEIPSNELLPYTS